MFKKGIHEMIVGIVTVGLKKRESENEGGEKIM